MDCTGSIDIPGLRAIIDKPTLVQYYVREYEHLIHAKLPACSNSRRELVETTFSLLNLKGFTMRMLSKEAKELVKLSSDIAGNNYPEIMYKMMIVNAPWVFRGAWAVIKPFIDPKTAKKISIHGESFQKELFQYVDPDNVPSFLGGNCTCDHLENGCVSEEVGPWDEYDGDDVAIYAKQMLEEETKEEESEQPETVFSPADKVPKSAEKDESVGSDGFYSAGEDESEAGGGLSPNKTMSVHNYHTKEKRASGGKF